MVVYPSKYNSVNLPSLLDGADKQAEWQKNIPATPYASCVLPTQQMARHTPLFVAGADEPIQGPWCVA